MHHRVWWLQYRFIQKILATFNRHSCDNEAICATIDHTVAIPILSSKHTQSSNHEWGASLHHPFHDFRTGLQDFVCEVGAELPSEPYFGRLLWVVSHGGTPKRILLQLLWSCYLVKATGKRKWLTIVSHAECWSTQKKTPLAGEAAAVLVIGRQR